MSTGARDPAYPLLLGLAHHIHQAQTLSHRLNAQQCYIVIGMTHPYAQNRLHNRETRLLRQMT
jgi:hypothetical protein